MIRWVVDNLSLSAEDNLVVIYNPGWMSMKNFMWLGGLGFIFGCKSFWGDGLGLHWTVSPKKS